MTTTTQREIKFRAWDPVSKRLSEPFSIFDIDTDRDGAQWVHFAKGDPVEFREGLLLAQFTGLKDKNRWEIYDGDIVRTSSGIGRVAWAGDLAGFEVVGVAGSRSLYGYMKEEKGVEIIGNTHENPELVK